MLRPKPKSIWLDHIVLASSNIESTVSEFHQLTGILPIFGGSHVGRGTCNYLTSLGTNSYLEIVGEDPNQIDTVTQMKAKGIPLSFGVDGLTSGQTRLAAWCCSTMNPSTFANLPEWAGKEFDMSRKTTTNDVLEWSLKIPGNGTTTEEDYFFDTINSGVFGVLPFFIHWKDVYQQELHPAQTSPIGIQLKSLCLEHGDGYDILVEELDRLELVSMDDGGGGGGGDGIDMAPSVTIKCSNVDGLEKKGRMTALLETPNGMVVLNENGFSKVKIPTKM